MSSHALTLKAYFENRKAWAILDSVKNLQEQLLRALLSLSRPVRDLEHPPNGKPETFVLAAVGGYGKTEREAAKLASLKRSDVSNILRGIQKIYVPFSLIPLKGVQFPTKLLFLLALHRKQFGFHFCGPSLWEINGKRVLLKSTRFGQDPWVTSNTTVYRKWGVANREFWDVIEVYLFLLTLGQFGPWPHPSRIKQLQTDLIVLMGSPEDPPDWFPLVIQRAASWVEDWDRFLTPVTFQETEEFHSVVSEVHRFLPLSVWQILTMKYENRTAP